MNSAFTSDEQVMGEALAGTRGESQKALAVEILNWGATLLRKNRDYGATVWGVPLLAPECDAATAIRVRMSDKISRLVTLLKAGSPEVRESYDDTLRDLGAYCLLELVRPDRDRPQEEST